MAVTLAELRKIETDPLRGSVMDTMLMESNVMQECPWETIGQLSTTIVRYADLPSVGFRKVNEAWSESSGTLEQRTENVAIMGGYIDCDKVIARANNTIADTRATQQTMKVKAMTYKFNDKFINGNPQSDPEEFKGLEKRVDDLYNEGFTGQRIDVAGGSVTEGILNSSATRHNFLDKLDQLIYAIKGHNPNWLFMNDATLLAIRSLLRREQLLDTTKDMFDRRVDVYGGARMVDIGVTADQTTEIVAENETTGGGTTECSIYAVKFGVGEFMWGIEEYPMEIDDLGLVSSSPHLYRTVIDWPLGLAMVDPYSIARLFGIIASAAS